MLTQIGQLLKRGCKLPGGSLYGHAYNQALLRMRCPVALAAIALTLGLTTSCGDSFKDVVLRNATDVTLAVYHNEGREVPASRVDIAAGTSHTAGWLWPISSDDFRSRRVEALDAQGQLIYCKAFSYRDLQRMGWKVEIVRERSC